MSGVGSADNAGKCVPTLCAKDEYVFSNGCRSCVAGKSIAYAGANGGGTPGGAGDASGTNTVCHATVCAADHHVKDIGSGVFRCSPCDTHMTRPAGDPVATAVTACTARSCATANKYVDAAHACQDCPVGTSAYPAAQSRATPSTSSCTAVTCLKDEYVKITGTCATTAGAADRAGDDCGATNREACTSSKAVCEASAAVPATWTKVTAVCTACPVGWTRTAGDNLATATATTTCVDPEIPLAPYVDSRCSDNEHVLNHNCVPCSTTYGIGYTRPAGDDPDSNTNTVCAKSVTPLPHGKHGTGHDTLCDKNFHVQNFACAACPLGTTNAAGDDPHHFDTTCQKTLCKVNEYVKDHECTPCEAVGVSLLTNTAGDDASGKNTECYLA
jgi:hypothetical protein